MKTFLAKVAARFGVTIWPALVRASRTAAQAALGVLGAGTIDLVTLDAVAVLSVAGGAALVSLLQSLAFGLPEAGPA